MPLFNKHQLVEGVVDLVPYFLVFDRAVDVKPFIFIV
jgi:hypothetical protein